MSLVNNYYLVNSTVISETIQNETIIINLENGYYYNLKHVASQVWSLIQLNIEEKEIIRIIASSYNEELTRIEIDIKTLFIDLINENLISIVAEHNAASGEVKLFVSDQAYALPKFEKYTDMSALLLADPVHEISK